MREYSFYSLCLLVTFGLLLKLQSKKENEADYIVISATYFEKSKFYPDNTMVVLFNAQKSISQAKNLICVSENSTFRHSVPSKPRFAYNPTRECKFATFVAVCNVLSMPISFGITKNDAAIAQVPFRKAFPEKKPVIVCFSPLFYFEKWELLLTTLELYRHYGAHLQVLYVQSMLKHIYSLLRLYSEEVAIEPWSVHDIDPDMINKIGFDPNLELDWRNQAAAHTDCTIKYREAADFIVIGDLDDVLIPSIGRSYVLEFSQLSTKFNTSLGFAYHRFNAVVDASPSSDDYSLTKVIRSMRISRERETFKYVIDTKRVETAWIHWPGIVRQGFELIILPESHFMLHLRNWTRSNDSIFAPNTLQLNSFIDPKDERQLQINFANRVKDKEEFLTLPTAEIYSKLMNDCYEKMFYSRKRQPKICPGPARCVFDPQPGAYCMVAKKYLQTAQITANLRITTPASSPSFTMYKSGCFMR